MGLRPPPHLSHGPPDGRDVGGDGALAEGGPGYVADETLGVVGNPEALLTCRALAPVPLRPHL